MYSLDTACVNEIIKQIKQQALSAFNKQLKVVKVKTIITQANAKIVPPA